MKIRRILNSTALIVSSFGALAVGCGGPVDDSGGSSDPESPPTAATDSENLPAGREFKSGPTIEVRTANVVNAGTDAFVTVKYHDSISGWRPEAQTYNGIGSLFERNTDQLIPINITLPINLDAIQVTLDDPNHTSGPSWKLDEMIVHQTWSCPLFGWIGNNGLPPPWTLVISCSRIQGR